MNNESKNNGLKTLAIIISIAIIVLNIYLIIKSHSKLIDINNSTAQYSQINVVVLYVIGYTYKINSFILLGITWIEYFLIKLLNDEYHSSFKVPIMIFILILLAVFIFFAYCLFVALYFFGTM